MEGEDGQDDASPQRTGKRGGGVKKILHLCADLGTDSKPYRDAGYEVICVGDKQDVRTYTPPEDVYGIIANPPCTNFSFARTNAKKPRDLRAGMELVQACLRIIWECQYRITSDAQKIAPLKFWVLENPNGMLKWFLGKPALVYSPHEYGDSYQKRTNLWGNFNAPPKHFALSDVKLKKFDALLTREIAPQYYGVMTRTERRSVCSEKFSKAFFECNR